MSNHVIRRQDFPTAGHSNVVELQIGKQLRDRSPVEIEKMLALELHPMPVEHTSRPAVEAGGGDVNDRPVAQYPPHILKELARVANMLDDICQYAYVI